MLSMILLLLLILFLLLYWYYTDVITLLLLLLYWYYYCYYWCSHSDAVVSKWEEGIKDRETEALQSPKLTVSRAGKCQELSPRRKWILWWEDGSGDFPALPVPALRLSSSREFPDHSRNSHFLSHCQSSGCHWWNGGCSGTGTKKNQIKNQFLRGAHWNFCLLRDSSCSAGIHQPWGSCTPDLGWKMDEERIAEICWGNCAPLSPAAAPWIPENPQAETSQRLLLQIQNPEKEQKLNYKYFTPVFIEENIPKFRKWNM